MQIINYLKNKIFDKKSTFTEVDEHRLKHLIITLTYQCQLSCKMCGQVNTPEGAPNSQDDWTKVNLEVLEKRINELEYPLKTAYLFGGEPLVYKDIFKLSNFLNKKQIHFSYSTNGLLLKKYVNNILNDPPHMISVSLDGYTPDLHDEIRGLKGSWQKALDGLETLIEEKKKRGLENPLLKIHFTITPDNYNTMREYYNFYINKFPEIDEIKFHAPRFADKKMGIEYFEIMEKEFQTNCMSYLGNFSDEEFVKECQKINIKKLHEDINWLLTQRRACYLGPTDLNELEMFFKVPSYYPRERKCVCFNSMAIQPNGDVVNCGDYPDLKFGNIREEKITDLWNSMRAKKWRKFLEENGNPGVLSKCSRLFKTKKSSNF